MAQQLAGSGGTGCQGAALVSCALCCLHVADPPPLFLLAEQEKEDKDKYDAAYAKYVSDAPEGSEARLLEMLAALAKQTEGATASQPDELNTVEALIEASREHNDRVHAQLRSLVQAFGGQYEGEGMCACARVCTIGAESPLTLLSLNSSRSGEEGRACPGEGRG